MAQAKNQTSLGSQTQLGKKPWTRIDRVQFDMFTLRHSNINHLIAQAQLGNLLQYNIYGDSAYCALGKSHLRARHNYAVNTIRENLENKALSSCREIIEWDYGNVGTMFPLVDYKTVLKLVNMPVKHMYLTAMILRNAFNTMNPGQTSQYFNLPPPSLEDWLTQGPAARPNIEAVISVDD